MQAQVLLASDSSIVKDWTDLASFSASGGTWSGNLGSVPQGGGYKVNVRCKNALAVQAAGANTFFVGMVFLLYGQSNMGGFTSQSNGSPPAANAATRYFDISNDTWTTVPAANGIRELLNGVNAATGVPCAALNCAVSATASGNLSANYASFVAGHLTAAGNAVEMMLVHQGEGDANSGLNGLKASWKANWNNIHGYVTAQIGRTKAQCPMVIGSLARSIVSGNTTDATWQAIKEAATEIEVETANVYYSHSSVDVAIGADNLHYNGDGQATAGKRFARTVNTLLGATTGRPRFFITGASVVDATKTSVTIAHDMGTDLTVGTSGWEVSGDNGVLWGAATASKTNATTIQVATAGNTDVTGQRLLRYQWGLAPDVSSITTDNSALAVPLNFSKGPIVPAATSPLPVPTLFSGGELNALTGSNQVQTANGLYIGLPTPRRMLIFATYGVCSNSAVMTITPNVGSAVTAAKAAISATGGPSYGVCIWYAVLGADADNATEVSFSIDYQANPSGGTFYSLYTVRSGYLSSTAPVGSGRFEQNGGGSISTMQTNVATSAGGFIVASAFQWSYAAPNFTWTGGTESLIKRTDAGAGGTGGSQADASNVGTSASSLVKVNMANATTGAFLAAASWR
ncbi:sialate O-acetylesterase [Bradyrhizobium sp. HKCCYLRH3099]|uniref:sialate O-acetylesterase n=1 Tax=unclassified Bradyrhizobium TaxID=2631580 RepID=UPI003EBE08E6